MNFRMTALMGFALAITPTAPAVATMDGHLDSASERQLELLQPILETDRAQENTGLVFAMSHSGQIVLGHHAGKAVIEHDIPMTPSSRFPIMSITKAFTGLALATAVHQGHVDLDTPIGRYLPDYAGEGAQSITLRQLATHTAGVPHMQHPDRRLLYVTHFETANASRAVYESRPLDFEPGSSYGYSSSGYNLIAAVLEAATGQDFKAYVRDNVIEPLGLSNTGFENVLEPLPGRVRNYSYVDLWAQPWAPSKELQQVPTWDFSYNLGGGNMYSTAGDLMRFGNAQLAKSGLHPDVWDLSLRLSNDSNVSSPWSLGWIHSQDADGRRVVSISGATPGVQAALYVYPEDELVFVALANCWCRNSAGADLVIGTPQRIASAYLSQIGQARD